MALSEFSLIQQYFSSIGAASGVALGVGDDCAVLDVPEGAQLVVTVDTLVAGVHFPVNASPGDIAHRCLRVNLSDIAAMGAEPRWFTLALTLPEASEHWVKAFSQALAEDASAFSCALVGGDTTAGPLTISIQLFGVVPKGKALTRGGAQVGDSIFVTGSLGEGAAALSLFDTLDTSVEAERGRLLKRFYRPEPRLEEGLLLRDLASAALDISDGLIADLGHIVEASGVGADVEIKQLPIEPWLACLAEASQVTQWALSGGDDYELCFTVSKENCGVVELLIAQGKLSACCIGKISRQPGVRCFDGNGNLVNIVKTGYQHFRVS
ncbi:MAG: thiamine-phosphate kinase [Porticoccaceae bacterium]|nr:MAG: thiamine-phosphate kinase [Porticoccaceae bacterium]